MFRTDNLTSKFLKLIPYCHKGLAVAVEILIVVMVSVAVDCTVVDCVMLVGTVFAAILQ